MLGSPLLGALLLVVTSCGGDPGTGVGGSFALTLSDTTVVVEQGGSGTVSVTVAPTGGFAGSVALSLEDAPAGVSGTFDPTSTSTTSTLTLTAAPGAEVGVSTLTVRGTAGARSASAELTLDVTVPAVDDTTPPTVLQTESTSNTTVRIDFSEAVTGTDDPARFTVFPELPVTGATPSVDGRSVTLTTAPQAKDQSYAVVISGVTDLAGNAYRPGEDAQFATTFIGTGQPGGTLTVNVLGLPEGVDAAIEVSGPGGFRRTVTGSTDLTGAPSGSYAFAVNDVSPDAATFSRESGPASLEFDGAAGGTVTFAYVCSAVEPPDAALDAALAQALGKATYTCADLRALTELDASGRGISDLEGLQYAAGLTLLNLAQNQLASLPEGLFGNTPALTTLLLSSNQINSLPRDLFAGADALELLNLNSNELTELPDGLFDHTPALRFLTLNNNELTRLPDGLFDHTPALRSLFLVQNRLASLPEGVFDHTPAMANLVLLGNRLTDLPTRLFNNTPALSDLNLGDNRLTSLPADVFDALPPLKRLSLNDNCLEPGKVPTRGRLAALQAQTTTFDASNNPASNCPDPLPAQPPVSSTFDAGAEGWTVTGDGENLEHVASGGAEGGYLQATDGAAGTIWYWKAPDLFYGDASDYYGRTLRFSLRQTFEASTTPLSAVDVKLVAGGFELELKENLTPPDTASWTPYSIELRAANFEPTLPGTEFAFLLESLTSLEIRGEYRNGADTGGLDSVTFGAP